jgi:phosphoribosylanthranilate isomerase
MNAFRPAGTDGLRVVLDYLETCRTIGCLPRLILFDAPLSRGFGGSGLLADWTLAEQYGRNCQSPKLVLAGGLKPENVAEAVRATGARAIDTASGVESAPGIKDPAAIKAFVRAARAAWGDQR